MPRKSLVLNGFLGGINKDGDLTDLESEDRQGRNQLSVCSDALCNQPGKIRISKPSAEAGSTDLTDGDVGGDGANTSVEDFLVHGTNYYREKGVYKLGSDIEWSEKTENLIRRPLQIGLGQDDTSTSYIQAGTIGLDAFGQGTGGDYTYLFLGKDATGGGANALLGDVDEHINPQDMVRWVYSNSATSTLTGSHYTSMDKCSLMGEFNLTVGQTVAFWDKGEAEASLGDQAGGDSTNREMGWDSQADVGIPVAGAYSGSSSSTSIATTDYIRFGAANASVDNNRDFGALFRVGSADIDGTTTRPPGIYGNDFIATDKDIFVEFELNTETDEAEDSYLGTWYDKFEKICFVMDNDDHDQIVQYSGSLSATDTKVWEITRDQLVNYGCANEGGARFKIPWGSAIHTGTNFETSSVKQIYFMLVGPTSGGWGAPDLASNKSVWVAKLYELSFGVADTVGWANSNTLFSQTKIYTSSTTDNKVESLPQPYSSALTLVSDTTLNIKVYQPTDTTYEGNIYYQTADDNGSGTGSLFLLAEVSKSKGVRSILSESYTRWDTLDVATCVWDSNASNPPNDTNLVTHPSRTDIKSGMKITGDITNAGGIAFYVDTVVNDTSFTLNTPTNNASSGAGSTTLTLSGTVILNYSDPPVSSTYQLNAGYPSQTETINAQWDHACTMGRQVYIGSVIKTGDDITMEAVALNVNTEASMYPMIDTIGYTNTSDADAVVFKVKINDLDTTNNDKWQFQKEIGASTITAYTGGGTTITADEYVSFTEGLKIKFPVGEGYTVNDEWTITLTREIDLVLKSAIGKRYGFPNTNYIDLELPGTGITAMAGVGDRLFVFSSGQLNVVNVAQDYEFLEGTFAGHGVADKKKVVAVNEGVAFVNGTGVYYFDGNKMESLSDDLMMTFNNDNNGWEDATNIGYLPKEKLICVWYDSGGGSTADAIISYSLATKAWVSNSLTNVGPDTAIGFYNNTAYWVLDAGTLHKLAIIDTTGDTVLIETGKISCGDLSRYKKFKKAFITINNGAEFAVKYKIDSGGWSDAVTLDDGITEIALNQKGKTIQFKIETDTSPDSGNAPTEISDLTLVYRDLRIN